MRLVLEIQSGELAGRKTWLRLGERVLVGRTEQAELPVPDSTMSSIHFFVECTATGCRLHDTRSTNGTYLNGKRVTDEALQDGDVIQAGETQFKVEITDEDSPPQSADRLGRYRAQDADRPATPVHKTVPIDPGILVSAGDSLPGPIDGVSTAQKLFRVRDFPGNPQEMSRLVQRLGEISPPYLFCDFARIGRPVPAELAAPSFLYDWLPEHLVAGFSPVVMGATAAIDRPPLFEICWGHDCLVCVFSPLPEAELVPRLRELTATGNPQQPHRKYASPEALADLLSNGPEKFVTAFFDFVDAALFEADSAEACRLVTSRKFAPQLP
jgi:hypothetical protein